MIIENIKPFIGQHCETTATGTLLNQIGIELSEPMIFGIGEGLSYGFFNFKMMPFPFMGGRPKPGEITENLCKNLGLELEFKETTSVEKAWFNIESELKTSNAVGLQLDCYHLEYFKNKIHFAGHFVAMYGYDKSFAYLVDTQPQGTSSKTSLKSLKLARSQKGPMAAKNKSFTISAHGKVVDPKSAIKGAIKRNAKTFLNPPITNLGYKGIKKTASELLKWTNKCPDWHNEIQTLAMIMERAGTGGSLFRNIYRDFILESADLLGNSKLKKIYPQYVEIASKWKEVADLFTTAGEERKIEPLEKACSILIELHELERKASSCLLDI